MNCLKAWSGQGLSRWLIAVSTLIDWAFYNWELLWEEFTTLLKVNCWVEKAMDLCDLGITILVIFFLWLFPERVETTISTNVDLTSTRGYFFPTREGNAFRGICHSVSNRPCGYSVTTHPCYGTVGMHPTRMLSCFCPQTKLWKGNVLHLSVILFTGRRCTPPRQIPPPRDGHYIGRYASYWNAFLFINVIKIQQCT